MGGAGAKSGKENASIYMVPAVERAVRILLMLSASDRGMTLAEIVSATGWHKSSVHKILMTLGHFGFLERDESTKRYVLGIELVRCGRTVLNHLQIHQSAKSFLIELADASGETANLVILRGNKCVVVDIAEAPVELRVSPPIGLVDPITAKSCGKAMLAWFPEEQVDEIIRTEGLPSRTGTSDSNHKLYHAELAIVHKQGYAIDTEEFQEGISAVSAPVFNSEKRVVGALSIIGPASRMTQEKLHFYGKKCVQAATQLSAMIR
jgi:IclR family transcriptional regulator, KDG regulon repressor